MEGQGPKQNSKTNRRIRTKSKEAPQKVLEESKEKVQSYAE